MLAFVMLTGPVAACRAGGDATSSGSDSSAAGSTSDPGAESSSAPESNGGSSTSGETTSGGAGSSSAASGSCVADLVASLTPQQRAGQLLMVAVQTGGVAGVAKLVANGSVGGVIYLGGWSGAATVAATSRELTAAAPSELGLFVAADQEGGEVQQLRGAGFSDIPSAQEQAALGSSELTRSVQVWAGELAKAGVNVNLAPVADVVPASIGTANGPIGRYHREYGATPAAAPPAVAAVIAGLHAGGLAATVKHFPGLGRISGNTDTTTVGITDAETTADDPALEPFAAGIKAGADMVMISSARYPKLDPANQATFSKAIITDLLRSKMAYGGVVITDDVGAAVAVQAVPVPDRATRFVAAGGDIVLTARASDITPMRDALVAAAAAEPAAADRITAAVTRVLTLKSSYGLTRCSPGE